MKKIIITLACGAAFICGCGKPGKDAKIDALNQKLDSVMINQAIAITNQFVLFNEVSKLKSQISLQSQYLNDQNYSYCTNLAAKIDGVQEGILLIVQTEGSIMKMNDFMATNLINR